MSAFDELASQLEPLEAFQHPWFVSGGWAIDLFLDEATRAHEDIEVSIFRSHQGELQACLSGWGLYKCARPGFWDPWDEGEHLELPVHQVLARPPGAGPPPEQWEPEPDELEFFLNEVEDGVWVCRRDPSLTRPVGEIQFTSASGIPTVAPEIQLLYKAKHHKDKDEHDFQAALGRLSAEQRAWLRGALEIVHPGDPWLEELA